MSTPVLSRSVKHTAAQNKNAEKALNIQKREKLKNLLVTKLIKKLNCPLEEKFILREVTKFIQKEKLTENDLALFEVTLKKAIEERANKEKLKENIVNEKDTSLANINPNANVIDLEEDKMSIANISHISHKSHAKEQLAYEEINNFELRKLLNAQKKRPLDNANVPRDWATLEKYKDVVEKEIIKNEKIIGIEKKKVTKEMLDKQLKEKESKALNENNREEVYHRMLMSNVEKLTQEEMKRQNEIKEKKLKEKELRDTQIQEHINKKKNEFVDDRLFDKTMSIFFL